MSSPTSKNESLVPELRQWVVTPFGGIQGTAEIMGAAADEIERLRGRMDHGTRQVAAIITWLEANQPDVFKRGLWDAIPKDPSFAHETRAKHRFTAEAKEGYCIHCGRVMGEHSKGDLCCPETTGVTP